MKAITYSIPTQSSQPPEIQISSISEPIAKAGEVLVEVHYAGLSNFDIETSTGKQNKSLTKKFKRQPVVSGIEMAGRVVSPGRRFQQGDRVVAYTHIFRGPFFHASRVAVPEKYLAKVPESISLAGATSIVGGALASISALERITSVQRGNTVFVTGASGGVGTTAVQLATYLGANVSTVAHSSQSDYLTSIGAVRTYAYDRNELPLKQAQFDVIFDTAPAMSFSLAKRYLTPMGCYITTMPQRDIAGWLVSIFSRRKWGYLMEYDTDEQRMGRLRELMTDGVFVEAIDSEYDLELAKEAFARQLERGKKGKILLNFDGS